MTDAGPPGTWGLVERLIAAYAPGDAGEEIAAFRSVLLTPAPFSRHQFEPGHFTASGLVLSSDGSSILLIHHRRLGRWMQPGGHIDATDPDPRAAARREIAEETGVVDLVDLGSGLFAIADHPIPARRDEPAHRHFDLRFAFVARSDGLTPSGEVIAAAWVRLDAVDDIGVDPQTRRHVERLRGET